MKRKNKLSKVLSLIAIGLLSIALASCGGNSEPSNSNESSPSSQSGSSQSNQKNETRPFTMASQEVDQVFSPFFSSSTSDSSVVSMTQISMLGNDKNGNPKTRKQGASVVTYDYEIKKDSTTSTYYFVLDNSIKFSNGSALTIKDVLFNMYVYLDPVYNGSSTMYSTDIVGLKQYRTQTDSESEQDSYMDTFNSQASQRIENLLDAFDEIVDDLGASESLTETSLREKLQAYETENGYTTLVSDYDKIREYFKEEVEDDFKSAKSASVDDYKDQFLDSKGNIQLFTHTDGSISTTPFETTQEIFLYNEGFITWSKKNCEFSFTSLSSLSEIRNLSEQECKNLVYNSYMPEKLDQVARQWQTASKIKTYIANELSKEYIEKNGKKYQNISGIKFANRSSAVTVNGVTYDAPTYNEDGSVKSGNEVLSVTINGEDPKAIWNFSFAVAPMYYYSNEEQIKLFDYESHFGVSYNDQNFRDNVLKDSTKIKVPMGAGAYKASSSNGKEVEPGTFYDGTTIYFERNEYFKDGEYNSPANIKYVYFRVVPTESVLSSLYSGSVDYCEPSAKPDTVSELQKKQTEGIETISNQTQGYGYVGINASKVKSLYVRQAIMHAIKVDDIVSYYGTTASRINRAMSKSSWAYPKNCTPYYPSVFDEIPSDLSVVSPNYKAFVESKGYKAGQVMTDADQKAFIKYLITDLGKIKADGDGNYDLSYTFTIAGASEDHPAYNAFVKAKNLLNSCGLQITVKKDSQALTKLTSGALEVWAAAWSSSLDPDMYQVYHKNSSATAILNWGYNAIYNNPSSYATEVKLINELSTKIMEARKTNVQSTRASIYKECLDIVMQLAIELPTYQREDLSAFNGNVLDKNSLVTGEELTSYTGVTSKLWRANEVA